MKIIYTPQGRAREYSPLALNIYNGCDHRCSYCYIKTMNSALLSSDNPVPRKDFIKGLTADAKVCDRNTQVLLSF